MILVLCTWPAAGIRAPAQEKPTGPFTPQQAIKHFRLPAGLRIDLVASEPQIESPVAMAFDEDGRIWVVEMGDYPNGPAKGQKPQGRIRILEDRDGDGFYETSRVFADGLLFANGLMPWKDGVIVTMAPKITWLRDTDGDGKADREEVLYEGFAAQNPQLRVSHPNLGIDNWIYVANGLRGGQAKKSGQADAPAINLAGMDFRFDPISGKHEAISGMGQFGNTFDDWGRRFVCDNRHHLRHVVIENRYLKRNPYLAAPAVVEDISELEDGPLFSGGKVYPISKNWTTSTLHEGRFTAACGVFIYRGDLLGGNHHGAAFTCEPTGNLVHEEILTQKGATFQSRPATKGVEFLATPDDWFRPVFITQGPDGALYIVDMYRAVIEHPDFMPPELQKRPDLTLGKDKGRIWRIGPDKNNVQPPRPQLGKATTVELVKLLSHPNAWWRTTAQRLLLQRQDRSAIEPLKTVVMANPEATNPGHDRVLAAWLLESFGALDPTLIIAMLKDARPRVREHGVRLAESRLKANDELLRAITHLAVDPDSQVRFQVALSLGESDKSSILPLLATLALADAGDKWARLAIASSVPNQAGQLLNLLFAQGRTTPSRLLMLQELAEVIGARQDRDEVSQLLRRMFTVPKGADLLRQMAVLNGVADGMGRRGTQLGAFLQTMPAEKRGLVKQSIALLEDLAGFAIDPEGEIKDRILAVRLLAHASWKTAQPVLAKLLADDSAQEIRLAAVRSLASHPEPDVAGLLMKSWRTYTPAVRREVTEAMFRQPARLQFLLDEVEAKRVKPGDLDSLRTRQLVNHADARIRDRAKVLLHDNLPGDRKQVLARYQESLKLKGDPLRGRDIFKKNCATCHRVAGIGIDVGPDIADSRTKTLEALLVDILNPNQAIDNNYINYQVTTKSGKSLSGIIVAETASSITLKRAEGQSDSVLRQDIDEIQSSGVSLMPDGLEKAITIAEMTDLLVFLKNWRYLDGAVPVK